MGSQATKETQIDNSNPQETVTESEEGREATTANQNTEISFQSEVDNFIQHIDSLATSFPLTQLILQGAHINSYKTYKKFLDEHCKVRSEDGKEIVEVEPQNIPEYNKLVKQANNSALAVKTVPRSLLVSLVSQFDSYLGRLLRVLFSRNPDLLKASERVLTLSQLVEFNSIEHAREYILEKEIETVLRKSHSEQFDWLEKKFCLPLRNDLPAWPIFIELTERRNLFVHVNGIISSQYLRVCKDHGSTIDEGVKVSSELDVNSEYFSKAYRCVYDIGVKLAQVLWRKQYPDEIEQADKHLNNVAYELLREEKNKLAISILDFATTTLKRHSNEENRRIAVVNRAQAYKWDGDAAKARAIVDAEDWTATSIEFKLAAAVLRDDFEGGALIMKKIGPDSYPRKSDYKEWPLFKEFRESKEFLSAFEKVFGEPFRLAAAEEEEISPEPPTQVAETVSEAATEVESVN